MAAHVGASADGHGPVPPKGSNLDRMCDAERRRLLGD
jgi:hypothetical protein